MEINYKIKMKNKIITLLKAIGIMVAFVILALVMGFISNWSHILHLSILLIAFIAGIYYWYRHYRPKKRYYFVSYAHSKGFGCRTIAIKNPVFYLMEVMEFIKKESLNGESNAVILYYKELSEDEYKEIGGAQ